MSNYPTIEQAEDAIIETIESAGEQPSNFDLDSVFAEAIVYAGGEYTIDPDDLWVVLRSYPI